MPKQILHSEAADWAIAELMNCLDDGQIYAGSKAHVELTNAVNTYLLERGIDKAELPKYWTGERQLTSS